jgi:membrane peptidoglycan carboxypeptidase
VSPKRGKLLGGKPPRRAGKWTRQRGGITTKRDRSFEIEVLGVLAAALFVLGIVGGFTWAMDRQLRGGILRQESEARVRADWVDVEALPAYVPRAFLAVVDPSFLRTGALRTGDDGTTLARELVSQVHLLPAGLGGNARELVMAPLLEHRATKRDLLELYMNRAYIGDHQELELYGIGRATEEYFGKQATELTLGEAATLAGLMLQPRITDPGAEAGAVGARRNEVLEVMLRGELITPDQYRAAMRERLGFQPGLSDPPMTRPADWTLEPEVIRLPPELRSPPDTLTADPLA